MKNRSYDYLTDYEIGDVVVWKGLELEVIYGTKCTECYFLNESCIGINCESIVFKSKNQLPRIYLILDENCKLYSNKIYTTKENAELAVKQFKKVKENKDKELNLRIIRYVSEDGK